MTSSKEYMRAWYLKNKEKVREHGKKYYLEVVKARMKTPKGKAASREARKRWREKHPEKARTINRDWARKNMAWLVEKQRKRRLKNLPLARAKQRAYAKKYRENNRGKTIIANRKWRSEHGAEYFREWDKKNPGARRHYGNNRRARKNAVTFDDSAKAFIAYVKSQEFVGCVYCGKIISGKEAHIDHLIALSRGGHHVGSNLRISCQGCNLSKHNKLLEEWKPELVGLI